MGETPAYRATVDKNLRGEAPAAQEEKEVMAKLTAQEEEMLEKLARKREAPDAPPVGKSISASIDLSDDKQIARAIEHGFLTAAEVKELKEEEKEEKKKDSTPRRRGSYFKDGDDE